MPAQSQSGLERTLVTILVADFVGFSALMAQREEETVRILQAHRSVVDSIIELRGGRIFNTAGDSILAEFRSPVEAVRSGMEIQEALLTRNINFPEDRRLDLRIGIHLGDVIVRGTDLLGDAVNIAARLESIADPGSICISSSVHDQVQGKLDLRFEPMGPQTLKNIPRAVQVFRISTQDPGTWSPEHTLSKRPVSLARILMALALISTVTAAGVWFATNRSSRPVSSTAQSPIVARSMPHWLNGSWMGILTDQAITGSDFCVNLDKRCREFVIGDVVGDGGYEGGMSVMGSGRGRPAKVTVSGKLVHIVTPTGSLVDVELDSDGLLKGHMVTADAHDYNFTMRKK